MSLSSRSPPSVKVCLVLKDKHGLEKTVDIHSVDVTKTIIEALTSKSVDLEIIQMWKHILMIPSSPFYSSLTYNKYKIFQTILSSQSLDLLNNFGNLWNKENSFQNEIADMIKTLIYTQNLDWADNCFPFILNFYSSEFSKQINDVYKHFIEIERWFAIEWMHKRCEKWIEKMEDLVFYQKYSYFSHFFKPMLEFHFPQTSYSVKENMNIDIRRGLALLCCIDHPNIVYDYNTWDLFGSHIFYHFREPGNDLPIISKLIHHWKHQHCYPWFDSINHPLECVEFMYFKWLDHQSLFVTALIPAMLSFPSIGRTWLSFWQNTRLSIISDQFIVFARRAIRFVEWIDCGMFQNFKFSTMTPNELISGIQILKKTFQHVYLMGFQQDSDVLLENGFELFGRRVAKTKKSIIQRRHIFLSIIQRVVSTGLAKQIVTMARFFSLSTNDPKINYE